MAKSAIRMDEFENVKKAQHNKYLVIGYFHITWNGTLDIDVYTNHMLCVQEEWLTGDENYDKSVSEESNELVRPATGFLLFL